MSIKYKFLIPIIFALVASYFLLFGYAVSSFRSDTKEIINNLLQNTVHEKINQFIVHHDLEHGHCLGGSGREEFHHQR